MNPPLPPGAPLAPGLEVIEHLNRGAHLDVYDAWSEYRACRCVAKVLRPDTSADAAARERLEREGALLQRLSHPHLVRAYETVTGRVGPVVVLEVLEGETLSRTIQRRSRRLPTVELAWLGLHLCSVLHYLHGEGLLHLDLKPSNIISHFGRAKVIDLSLARPPGEAPAGIGTSQYLAPEQARGGEVGPAADVWGVGGVLFAAATGQRPFRARTPGGSYQQLERRAVPVRSLRRLPAALAGAIDACLEPETSARPTVSALAATLDEVLDQSAVSRTQAVV